jgi:hypothetical protein
VTVIMVKIVVRAIKVRSGKLRNCLGTLKFLANVNTRLTFHFLIFRIQTSSVLEISEGYVELFTCFISMFDIVVMTRMLTKL